MCVECLETIAWERGRGYVSSLASVEQAKEKEDNCENDDYIKVVAPGMTIPVIIVRDRGSCGFR